MAQALSNAPSMTVAIDSPRASARVGAMPWYVWSMLAATTSVMAGAYCDISWHISIGRDTFWTPAHMAIYLAAVIAGTSAAWLIFTTTFGSDSALRESSVRVLGFRGPLAAFVAAWGGGMMLTSAPFDNWWHNAYGLDVKIVSPPHAVLSMGVLALNLSALLMASTAHNRAQGVQRRRLGLAVLYVGACIVVQVYTFSLESTGMALMHSSVFYGSMDALPMVLLAAAAVSESRWAITIMTGIYTALWIAGLWIMPLFSATPRLGPVYQHITHFVPLWFPALLIVPGFAMDLVRQRLGKRGKIVSAVVLGCVFMAVLIAAQWPFADFLMTPAARNWVFGANYFVYWDPANVTYDPYRFIHKDATSAAFAWGMASAFIFSCLFAWIGLGFGEWMRKERR